MNFFKRKKKKKEIPLIYSSGFKNYLMNLISIANINGDSKTILYDIYSLENVANIDISFIDITGNEDTITFISHEQIKKCYDKLNTKKTISEYLTSEKNLTNFGLVNHIKNYKGVWNTARNEMKIGKFIRKAIPRISDKDLEYFVNNYKTIFNSKTNRNFEIVNGEDIKKWYKYTNYKHNLENVRGLGDLGKSCMRHVSESFFDIYSENKDVCSLVLLKTKDSPDKIIGRALLWKLDTQNGKEQFYMDRIYTHFESDIFAFRNFAKENGWLTHYDIKREEDIKLLSVKLSESNFYYYPYMDSFCFLNKTNNTLSTKKIKFEEGINYYLQNTSGRPETIYE